MGRAIALIRQFQAGQRQYFRLARQEVAARNLLLVRALSLTTAGLLLILLCISPFLISGWSPTLNHLLLLPASLLVWALAELYARRGQPTSLGVTMMCLLFEAVLFVLIILIDVIPTPDAPGTFMPLLCVVLPSMFVFPLSLSYGVVAVFEVIYILAVLAFKNDFIGQYDIFNSIVGIIFSLALSLVIARLRVRDHEARLRYQQLSTQDFLTEILNKQSFQEAACRYLLGSGSDVHRALLILDVDDFKNVNDSRGHFSGDRLLRSIGKLLSELFRSTDLIGRFGGDEFIILMKGPASLSALDEKCRQIQTRLLQSQESDPLITCSIGGVSAEGQQVSFEQLFRQADAALYQAKAAGKNRYCLETCRPEEGVSSAG